MKKMKLRRGLARDILTLLLHKPRLRVERNPVPKTFHPRPLARPSGTWIFLIAALALFSARGFAADTGVQPLFGQANDLYSKGQYDKAIVIYEDILSKGISNAALYYNLGDAYFKTQRYGKSVACFERAARLKPRDTDIRYNLGFLRAMVKEPVEPFPEILLTSLNGLVTLNELAVLCSAVFILLICGIGLYIALKQRNVLLFNIIFAVLAVVLCGWLAIKIESEVLTRDAIVVSGPADVRNGPGMENSVGFSLPEGRKVVILGAKDDWSAIGLKSEGLKGWIEKKYLEEI